MFVQSKVRLKYILITCDLFWGRIPLPSLQGRDLAGIYLPRGRSGMHARGVPMTLLIVSALALALAIAQSSGQSGLVSLLWYRAKDSMESSSVLRSLKNDTLVGLQDPVFWFLAPLWVVISVGVCAIINLIILLVINIFTALYMLIPTKPNWLSYERR